MSNQKPRALRLVLFFIVTAVFLSGKKADSDTTDERIFYIVNTGIHTGIVFENSEESEEYIEALLAFKSYVYSDIGWGDADYYQAGTGGPYLTAKALLVPSSSTVVVRGTDMRIEDITRYCVFSIKYRVSREQFHEICRFIDGSFSRTANGGFIILSVSASGNTTFFKSVYHYHLFNTCNTWIADAFKKAGIRVNRKIIITADNLYEAVSGSGEIIKPN